MPARKPKPTRADSYPLATQPELYVATYEENHPGADVTPEEFVFLKAMERFQRKYNRRFPTYREVLSVAKSLGYRKVARARELDFELLYPVEAAQEAETEPTPTAASGMDMKGTES